MSPTVILLAVSALGIEVGWEPLPGGGHEYTIQLEPQMLEILKRGDDEIFSEVPPDVEVRRYRLLVGSGKLSRVTRRPPAESPEAPPGSAGQALGSTGGDRAAQTAAELPPSLPRSALRDDAGSGRRSEAVHAQKPTTGMNEPPVDADSGRPWFAFTTAMVLLCCSLGANIYLGWTTWDARSRYRAALTKGGIAPAT